ncbi:Flagellar L-ring protein precursor [Mariniblastus fucicola]|uniref:Flagellar L-ring protein n=2 Tax=Mariniblastus fucicola TaxID=980251 RepID=A0A5B9PAT6_9BACT|nr:Flagellar L-ring protein precursor [Mariniblastus fucicola]
MAIVASLFVLTTSPETAKAQSLFERRSANQIDQYRNYAARQRGDLLSVVISESTDVENRDERSLDKSGNSNISGGLSYSLGGGLGGATGDGALNQSSSSSRGFTGDSEFRSERQFLDRFTVTVIDVQPNGNLVISGERNISVQGDSRTLRLSGVVRQIDLLPDNSISSRFVANLDIRLSGKGTEQKFNKQGSFSRRINRLWPF